MLLRFQCWIIREHFSLKIVDVNRIVFERMVNHF